MKYLTEITEDCEYLIEKREDGVKNYYIHGPYMQAETKNRNGRVYPRAIMEKEVNRYQTLIKERRALGELNHPASPSINLDRVSHLITELKFEGNNVMGRAKLLDTPMGKIAKNFVDENIKLGVSSRGLGSLTKCEDHMRVGEDFHLACVDIVQDPSGINCFVSGIMENVDWYFDVATGTYAQKTVENIHVSMKKMTTTQIDEAKIQLWEQFLKDLAQKL